MKKINKLTESNLRRIIKRVIKESFSDNDSYENEIFNITAKDCIEPKKGFVVATNDVIYIEYCRGDRDELNRLKELGKKEYFARLQSYN